MGSLNDSFKGSFKDLRCSALGFGVEGLVYEASGLLGSGLRIGRLGLNTIKPHTSQAL